MIYPVIPSDKKVIISVEMSGYIVARYIQTAPYTFVVQHAENWQDLEAQARQAVLELMGAPANDVYPCPPDLAEQAVWPE